MARIRREVVGSVVRPLVSAGNAIRLREARNPGVISGKVVDQSRIVRDDAAPLDLRREFAGRQVKPIGRRRNDAAIPHPTRFDVFRRDRRDVRLRPEPQRLPRLRFDRSAVETETARPRFAESRPTGDAFVPRRQVVRPRLRPTKRGQFRRRIIRVANGLQNLSQITPIFAGDLERRARRGRRRLAFASDAVRRVAGRKRVGEVDVRRHFVRAVSGRDVRAAVFPIFSNSPVLPIFPVSVRRRDLRFVERLNEKVAVLNAEAFVREPDDSLNEVDVRVGGGTEDGDVPTFQVALVELQLADENAVAGEGRRADVLFRIRIFVAKILGIRTLRASSRDDVPSAANVRGAVHLLARADLEREAAFVANDVLMPPQQRRRHRAGRDDVSLRFERFEEERQKERDRQRLANFADLFEKRRRRLRFALLPRAAGSSGRSDGGARFRFFRTQRR